MRRRVPRPVGISVEALTARLAPATVLAEVQNAWRDSVGPAVADAAQPTGERDGVVTVSCSASVWAQELDLLGPQLVARINAQLGRPAVRSLRCRVSPAGSPARGAGTLYAAPPP
jgi:predicted nucleic acid-binding Zn ribbon protein